jgi:hypothetical protein
MFAVRHTMHTSRRGAPAMVRYMGTGKDIYFGADARARMLEGVNSLADAVQVRGILGWKNFGMFK